MLLALFLRQCDIVYSDMHCRAAKYAHCCFPNVWKHASAPKKGALRSFRVHTEFIAPQLLRRQLNERERVMMKG